jgi:glycosyltransferase involved in cell wall biosynthesis
MWSLLPINSAACQYSRSFVSGPRATEFASANQNFRNVDNALAQPVAPDLLAVTLSQRHFSFGSHRSYSQRSSPMTDSKPRIIAVMPAYNAALTLEKTIRDIPADTVDEVILVDDCSTDETVAVAESLGLTVIRHEQNTGYGGNQKTCYTEALSRGADIVVMIHPDYQYDSRVIGVAAELIRLGNVDVILGSRIRTRAEALKGGMPGWKYIANRCLTIFENIALGQNLGDFHSGFRAYRKEVLQTIPWRRNSDDFVFDTQFLAQSVTFGFRLGDIPVPVRYFAEASSINFRRSTRYGLLTLWVMVQFWLNRLKLARPAYLRPVPEDAEAD